MDTVIVDADEVNAEMLRSWPQLINQDMTKMKQKKWTQSKKFPSIGEKSGPNLLLSPLKEYRNTNNNTSSNSCSHVPVSLFILPLAIIRPLQNRFLDRVTRDCRLASRLGSIRSLDLS